MRVGVLCATGMVRFIAQAGMCLALLDDTGHGDGSEPGGQIPIADSEIQGTVAQLLVVLIAFEDGQGFITFLLFGLASEVVALVHQWHMRLRTALFAVAWSVSGSAGAP